MRAYESPAKVTSEGKLEVPDALLKCLPSNQVVKVIVLVSDQEDIEEQVAWSSLISEQFFGGYDDVDAIYDRL